MSATVIARTAVMADALATAAFVLGPIDGVEFLEHQGAEGVIVSALLKQHETAGLARYRPRSRAVGATVPSPRSNG